MNPIITISCLLAVMITIAVLVIRAWNKTRKATSALEGRALDSTKHLFTDYSVARKIHKYDEHLAKLLFAIRNVRNIDQYRAAIKAIDRFKKTYEPICGWLLVASDTTLLINQLEKHEEKVLQLEKDHKTFTKFFGTQIPLPC